MYDLSELGHNRYDELTALWNLCWAGSLSGEINYRQLNPQLLAAYVNRNLICLPSSVGLFQNGKLIGYSLLAVNAQEGWIAAIGIDPAYRGKGLARILLSSQLHIVERLKLKHITLEVSPHHYAARVYQACGFKYWRKLNNFEKPCLNLSNSSALRHDEVAGDVYFQTRGAACAPFSWRRKECVLKRNSDMRYYLSKNIGSGCAVAGTRVIDIWACSRNEARSILALALTNPADTIIHHQAEDWISIFLIENNISPSSVQYEMRLSF